MNGSLRIIAFSFMTVFHLFQMSRTITFVTGNAKKLEEFVAILGTNFPFKVVSNPCRLKELKDIFKKKISVPERVSI